MHCQQLLPNGGGQGQSWLMGNVMFLSIRVACNI